MKHFFCNEINNFHFIVFVVVCLQIHRQADMIKKLEESISKTELTIEDITRKHENEVRNEGTKRGLYHISIVVVPPAPITHNVVQPITMNMWLITTKATSFLLLKKLRFLHYLTEDSTSFPIIPNSQKLKRYFWKYNFYKMCISFYFPYVHYPRINLADKMYPLL